MTVCYDPNQIHFTSDTHFWHSALIKNGHRKFDDVEHMNYVMARNWNEVVAPGDVVFFLGDFCFSGTAKAMDILNQLQGRIFWVPGNHDKTFIKDLRKRSENIGRDINIVDSVHEIDVWVDRENAKKQRITLCHYPMLTWNRAHHGAWMLHGHSHGSCQYPYPKMRIYDVGVDQNDFAPVSFSRLQTIMADRGFHAVDHHTEKSECK